MRSIPTSEAPPEQSLSWLTALQRSYDAVRRAPRPALTRKLRQASPTIERSGYAVPEGPEIRRAADRIERALGGHEAEQVSFAFPRLHRYQKRLAGVTVESIETHGKAMLLHFGNGLSIYSHSQLYGRWYVMQRGSLPRTGRSLRLAIHTARKSALLYSASEIDVMQRSKLGRHRFLAKLGPDLLAPGSDEAALMAHVSEPRFARRQLQALLLDQSFIAGVGNYLRSEILFVARLHPRQRLGDLDEQERRRLAQAIRGVGRRAYRTGGITNDEKRVRELKQQGMRRGAYRHHVFTRGGKPCWNCGTKVRSEVISGRKVFHCPRCQREAQIPGQRRK